MVLCWTLLIIILLVGNLVSGKAFEVETGRGKDVVLTLVGEPISSIDGAKNIEEKPALIYSDLRIYNGETVKPGEFPFMVSVQDRLVWSHLAGGTLVTRSHVLTACHSLTRKTNSKKPVPNANHRYSVLAGTLDISEAGQASGIRRYSDKLHIHPQCYGEPTLGWFWDIGMITVDYQFPIRKDSIELISFPIITNSMVDNLTRYTGDCTAIGWGSTAPEVDFSRILMKVKLGLQQPDVCLELLRRYLASVQLQGDNELCALGSNGRDTCTGDSGSPLLCHNHDGKKYFCAVVSWGFQCGKSNLPGVYARVDAAEPWMRSIIDGSGNNDPSFLMVSFVLTGIFATL